MRWMAALWVMAALAVAGAQGEAPSRTVKEARAILEETGAKPRQIFEGKGHVGSIGVVLRPRRLVVLVSVVPTAGESVDLEKCRAELWRGDELVKSGPYAHGAVRDLVCEGSQTVLVHWDLEEELGEEELAIVALTGGGVDASRSFRGAVARRESDRTTVLTAPYLDVMQKAGDGEDAEPAAEENEGAALLGALGNEEWRAEMVARFEETGFEPESIFEGKRSVTRVAPATEEDGAVLRVGFLTMVRSSDVELPRAEDAKLWRNGKQVPMWKGEEPFELEPVEGDSPGISATMAWWRMDPPLAAEDSLAVGVQTKETTVLYAFDGAQVRSSESIVAGTMAREAADKTREFLEKMCSVLGTWFENDTCAGCVALGTLSGGRTMLLAFLVREDGDAVAIDELSVERNGIDVPLAHGSLDMSGEEWLAGGHLEVAVCEMDGAPAAGDAFAVALKGNGIEARARLTGQQVIDNGPRFAEFAEGFEEAAREIEAKSAAVGEAQAEPQGVDAMAAAMAAEGIDATRTAKGEMTVATLVPTGSVRGGVRGMAVLALMPGSTGALAPEGMVLLRNGEEVPREREGKVDVLQEAGGDVPGIVAVTAHWYLDGKPAATDRFELRAKGTDVDVRCSFGGEELARAMAQVEATREGPEMKVVERTTAALMKHRFREMLSPTHEGGTVGTIVPRREGERVLQCSVVAASPEGTPMVLLPSGIRLVRNGVALEPSEVETPTFATVEKQGIRATTMTMAATWELDGPIRADDAFVVTAKGRNVDLRREFAGRELPKEGLMLVAGAAGADEDEDEDEDEGEVEGAMDVREHVRETLVEEMRSRGIADDRIFAGEKAVVGVTLGTEDALEVGVMLYVLEMPGESVSFAAEGPSMERGGRTLGAAKQAAKAVVLPSTDVESGEWIAMPMWALDRPAQAGETFAFAATIGDVDVRVEFDGAEARAPARPEGESAAELRLRLSPYALASKHLGADMMDEDKVFYSNAAAAVVLVEATPSNRLLARIMAVAVPGKKLSLDAAGVSLERNGRKVAGDPMPQPALMPVGHEGERPTMMMAFPVWRLGSAPRSTDKFMLRAKGENVDVTYWFAGADVMTEEQLAAESEASWAESGTAPGTTVQVPCEMVGGHFAVKVAFTVGGQRRERALLVDTGATLSMLPESALPPGIDVDAMDDSTAMLGDGRVVATKVATMRIEVGGLARDVRVGVMRGEGGLGVLGANFFGDATCTLDPATATMTIAVPGEAAGGAVKDEDEDADEDEVERVRGKVMEELKRQGVPDAWIVQGRRTVASMLPMSTSAQNIMIGVRVDELPGGEAELYDEHVVVTFNGEVLEDGLLSEENPEEADELGRRRLRVTKRWHLPKAFGKEDVFVVTAKGGGADAQWTLTGDEAANAMATMALEMGKWLDAQEK